MAEDNYSGDVLDYFKELASSEAEKYGAAKEPIQQYQQSQINLDRSLQNINDARSTALRDLDANTRTTERDLINNILGSANPLALNQAKLDVKNQQAVSLKNIREQSQADIDTYNNQKEQSQTAFTDSLGYNQDFLANMFNRVLQRAEDKAWIAGDSFDKAPLSEMLNKYISDNFKPIWSNQDYINFKDKIK